jgi:preprotein translocase subunit SecA
MFSAMMAGIQDNFVQYVSHLKVVTEEQQAKPKNLQYSASEAPVQGSQALQAAAAGIPVEEQGGGVATAAPAQVPPEEVQMQPVKVDKTPGRNEPCYCGSGKKFKHCHGR